MASPLGNRRFPWLMGAATIIYAPFKGSPESWPTHWLALVPCKSVSPLHLLLHDLHLMLVSRDSPFLVSCELSPIYMSLVYTRDWFRGFDTLAPIYIKYGRPGVGPLHVPANMH